MGPCGGAPVCHPRLEAGIKNAVRPERDGAIEHGGVARRIRDLELRAVSARGEPVDVVGDQPDPVTLIPELCVHRPQSGKKIHRGRRPVVNDILRPLEEGSDGVNYRDGAYQTATIAC